MSSAVALSWLVALLGAAGAGTAAAALHESQRTATLWALHIARLEHELRYHGARLTGRQLAGFQRASCALLVVLSIAASPFAIAAALVVVAAGPTLFLRRLRVRRTARIEAQLDGFLLALAHSLRATPALGDGLKSCADVVAPPLADELNVLLHEHDLGTPLDRALENMAGRVGSPVVSAALSMLRIARSAGGDFVHTLERSAATLREMARLQGVIRTKTAEGRAQTVVVSALPVPTLYLIDSLSPTLLEPLWTTDAGHVLLAIALVIWVVAFFVARRITHVDI